jgi:7-keto-8-aminopelargonate synthetase-like enzyme
MSASENQRHHNTTKLVDYADPYFAAAHLEGLMALYARPLPGRAVQLSKGLKDERRIVDFVRCSYLGLDNHPSILEGAINAVKECGALHWSCARTRLNFDLLGYARSNIGGALGDRTIIAASLGKGFGASGGMLMLGTERQAELFRRYALPHAFSASPNLAAIGAALASEAIHRTSELRVMQDRLRQRTALFDLLFSTSFAGNSLPIRTCTIGDELAAIGAAKAILELGFYTSAIFFPTVARGRAGLRICPTAGHSDTEIIKLCKILTQTLGSNPQ